MRWLKPFTPLVLVLFAVPARAQDAAPQPTETPAPAAQPPPPPPPAPAPAQVFDGEQPPAQPRPTPLPARRHPRVEEKPERTAGFGIELATAGFASGELRGGLLLGVHLPNGSLFGARFDYRDRTIKVGSDSNSTTATAIGFGGRFAVAGSHEGLDLALALDASFLKAESPDAASSSGDKGTGFSVGFGPQLRYWFLPNLAAGYIAQFTYTSISVDSSSAFGSGSRAEQSLTAFAGTFTLTAGF